ncbi:restriction endonuclease [Armatimonas rosea]|uniref:Restriction endonuclease Mrr n=1 Tax=Armatimonas rosea TaxID=685828 RepID=A0A7W9WAQ0_ARMRO|nr:restriction endonuclease [Armatimonas rosea]MBB6053852.1 restriction endonuclease Mrr [Armatimonas rosea]
MRYLSQTTSPSETLLERLRQLPFDAFTLTIASLLDKLGYQDIQPAGRTDWKGRNRAGGVDLTATYVSAAGKRSIAFQLKQFQPNQRLFQRAVDELRGVCLRQGAAEGMLITTSGYSPTITGTQGMVAPLYLMSGEELALLLRQYRIGVTKGGKLDEDFFKGLERKSQGNRPGVPMKEKPDQVKGKYDGDLVVTVSLRQNRSSLWRRPALRQDPSDQPF